MMILKIVGYAEQVAQYYQLEDFKAHIWIAHQRYPTKGRVWHPGGAHPFIGMHEALVHNGDFANYHSVCEYLKQRNVFPLFLTDTEVSVLMLDLLNRVYGYPLEYIIESLAPTTEMDFDQLPPEKQKIYRAIQATQIHGSPDGPWFFIIARNDPYKRFQLIGITDTAMLRPQVFALQEGGCRSAWSVRKNRPSTPPSTALPRKIPASARWPTDTGTPAAAATPTAAPLCFGLPGHRKTAAMSLTCTDKFGTGIAYPERPEPAFRPDH